MTNPEDRVWAREKHSSLGPNKYRTRTLLEARYLEASIITGLGTVSTVLPGEAFDKRVGIASKKVFPLGANVYFIDDILSWNIKFDPVKIMMFFKVSPECRFAGPG